MRGFKKISFEQFKKDVCDDKDLYDSFALPNRKTKYSAGYDFHSLIDFTLKPGEMKRIPTGVKAYFQEDEMLMLVVRSSTGFKYNVRLANQVGIIESDYYNNISNEGHMWLAVHNHGDQDYNVLKGGNFAQGIFTKFLIAENENIDEMVVRTGGLGSTNKEEENE